MSAVFEKGNKWRNGQTSDTFSFQTSVWCSVLFMTMWRVVQVDLEIVRWIFEWQSPVKAVNLGKHCSLCCWSCSPVTVMRSTWLWWASPTSFLNTMYFVEWFGMKLRNTSETLLLEGLLIQFCRCWYGAHSGGKQGHLLSSVTLWMASPASYAQKNLFVFHVPLWAHAVIDNYPFKRGLNLTRNYICSWNVCETIGFLLMIETIGCSKLKLKANIFH